MTIPLPADGGDAARPSPSGSAEMTRDPGAPERTALYVYGILPGDTGMRADARGVGKPPGQVRLVRWRDLAAMVSDVDPAEPLGSPDDLRAHAELLDAVAAEVPVLPLRFGAVLPGEDLLTREVLGDHHDELANALRELERHVQYVIKGRYVEPTILQEVLSENPEAARLATDVSADPVAARPARVTLGEMISNAVSAKRAQDTRVMGDALVGIVAASAVRPPTHELDAVYIAVLVAADAGKDLERAIAALARDWDGRIDLRLIGPMAAYDFTATTQPGGWHPVGRRRARPDLAPGRWVAPGFWPYACR